jgi:hypothetical protein
MATWKDPITLATLVIAVSTVVSVVVSVLMWAAMRRQTKVTQAMFEAAYRPYIGAIELSPMTSIQELAWTVLTLQVKNSGSIPAFGLTATWKLLIDGQSILQNVPSQKLTLLPNTFAHLNTEFTVAREVYEKVKIGKLRFSVTIDYQGVKNKKYRYTQHGETDRKGNYVLTFAESD